MTDVTKGIALDLSGLSEKDKKKLIKVMSHISEASYRRGLNHGCIFKQNHLFQKNVVEWCYKISLARSPLGEFGVMKDSRSSIELLFQEYRESLNKIGLEEPKETKK